MTSVDQKELKYCLRRLQDIARLLDRNLVQLRNFVIEKNKIKKKSSNKQKRTNKANKRESLDFKTCSLCKRQHKIPFPDDIYL